MIMVFGALAAAFALIVELAVFSLFTFSESASVTPLPMNGVGLSFSILLTLLLGALIEEASKYLFLVRYGVLRLADRKVPMGGALILGLLFGLGFSLPEAWSVWYAIGFVAAPISGIVLIHTLTSVFLAATLLVPTSRINPRIALILAIILHIAYNVAAYVIFPAY